MAEFVLEHQAIDRAAKEISKIVKHGLEKGPVGVLDAADNINKALKSVLENKDLHHMLEKEYEVKDPAVRKAIIRNAIIRKFIESTQTKPDEIDVTNVLSATLALHHGTSAIFDHLAEQGVSDPVGLAAKLENGFRFVVSAVEAARTFLGFEEIRKRVITQVEKLAGKKIDELGPDARRYYTMLALEKIRDDPRIGKKLMALVLADSLLEEHSKNHELVRSLLLAKSGDSAARVNLETHIDHKIDHIKVYITLLKKTFPSPPPILLELLDEITQTRTALNIAKRMGIELNVEERKRALEKLERQLVKLLGAG